MAADHFCLRWNNYQNSMVSELDILRTEEYLVDVTLCCEGHKFRAHKVILSACSPYFRNVFKENPCEHPVVILKDVLPEDVEALLSFVYQGVVYVSEKKLASFLQTAELLQIKGLAGAASSFNEEQAKQAAAALNNSPVKRRKGAPVRIVKHGGEGGDDSFGGAMDAEDDNSVKNDLVDDGDELKNDEDGSLEEESESENSGYATGSCYSNPGDLKDENADRYWANSVGCSQVKQENVEAMLQQAIASQQLSQPQGGGQWQQSSPLQTMPDGSNLQNNSPGPYQGTPQSQGLPDLSTSPAVRNGRRPCPLCTKVISNKSNLLKHMRIRHSDVYNPICCVLCNKLFKNKYSLRAHVNIYHKEFITTSSGTTATAPPQQPPPISSTTTSTTNNSSAQQQQLSSSTMDHTMTSINVVDHQSTPGVPLPPPPLLQHPQYMQSVEAKFPLT